MKWLCTLLVLIASTAAAQYPAKPVRVIVPFPPGGTADLLSRTTAQKLAASLGQQFIVESRAGAGGNLGAEFVYRAEPDGYTLLATPPHILTVNPLLYTLAFDPTRFVPVSIIAAYPNVLRATPRLAASTLDELIAQAKENPGRLNIASQGNGTISHLSAELLKSMASINLTHVPYKGTAEWTQALLGGEVHFICDGAQWAPFVDSGKFRILAMATERRIAKYKDVPTLKERGIDVVGQSPYGLVGPKDLPADVVEAVHLAFKAAMADPRVDALLDSYIQAPWYKTPAEYRAFAEKYFADVKPLLIKSGLAKG